MEPTLFLIGFVIDIIGELMLGISVIIVHGKLSKERRIDEAVQHNIEWEKRLGILAVCMIVIGSGLQFINMM